MKTFLVLVVELAMLLAVAILFSYLPFRAWWRRRVLEPFDRRVVQEIKDRRRVLADRHAEVLLAEARDVLPRVVEGGVPLGHGLPPVWVVRWWYSAQVAIPVYLAGLTYFALIVWNAGDIFFRNSRGSHPVSSGSGPLGDLVGWFLAIPESIRNWEGPAEAFEALRGILVVLVLMLAVPLITRVSAALSHSPERRRQRERAERKTRVVGDYLRCWPVVVLVVAAVQCAQARRRWQEGQPGDDVPRVSLKAVESVIWRAPRSRRGDVRSHYERVVGAHTARVVGALRKAEARQDTDPEQALQALTVLLLTIAERYAEGRVGQLLDEEQIGDAEPVVPRERLRLAIVGLMVVLAVAGASLAGLPEAALVALLPVAVIGAAITVNRGKIPTPGQLTDLIIPR
ncbi:hypothetical protein [Streptomyces sp. ISL-43]|uniref:hypothetical protein n=1 Tax=Streptomyces sp. ISL-43 TaxID=2819183 RepID=UPI00203617BD|nr:hypothetical protein [Streptomyces sp. ISL-43]